MLWIFLPEIWGHFLQAGLSTVDPSYLIYLVHLFFYSPKCSINWHTFFEEMKKYSKISRKVKSQGSQERSVFQETGTIYVLLGAKRLKKTRTAQWKFVCYCGITDYRDKFEIIPYFPLLNLESYTVHVMRGPSILWKYSLCGLNPKHQTGENCSLSRTLHWHWTFSGKDTSCLPEE